MTFVLLVLTCLIGGLLVLAVLLPLTKIRFGAIEGLAFPRQQFLFAALACVPLFLWLAPSAWGGVAAGAMVLTALAQALYIAKFTPFWPKQSVQADAPLKADTACQISVLTANVKMSNRDYDPLIALIQTHAPDVVTAIEVDAAWTGALKTELAQDYPHWEEVPQDNGYGLCVMSRLPLGDVTTRDLVTQNVPSIKARVTLRSGHALRLYVVHPEPPVLTHDTKGRDSEIALVGLEAAQDPLPTIVTGDLNDVAWSTTTRRFQRLSHLLDPRVGRGFYNTFSATHPWMRWPLDHLFHDKRFRLIDMARLGKIGSDHFPMLFRLALAETQAFDVDPGRADAGEIADTKDMIKAEQDRPRRPIGEDWEDG